MNKSPEFDMLKEPAEPERRDEAVESQRDREPIGKATQGRGLEEQHADVSSQQHSFYLIRARRKRHENR